MTPELLGIENNLLLFGMLYRMNAVEQVGSGVRRIREICRDYGVAAPDYEINDHWVTMTFQRPKLVNGVRVEQENEGLVETPGKTRVKTRVETPGKTPDLILEILKQQPELTQAEVATAIGKSTSAVERACAKLVKAGRLRHVGARKGGHWEVLK